MLMLIVLAILNLTHACAILLRIIRMPNVLLNALSVMDSVSVAPARSGLICVVVLIRVIAMIHATALIHVVARHGVMSHIAWTVERLILHAATTDHALLSCKMYLMQQHVQHLLALLLSRRMRVGARVPGAIPQVDAAAATHRILHKRVQAQNRPAHVLKGIMAQQLAPLRMTTHALRM
jgi:hypothetical protein